MAITNPNDAWGVPNSILNFQRNLAERSRRKKIVKQKGKVKDEADRILKLEKQKILEFKEWLLKISTRFNIRIMTFSETTSLYDIEIELKRLFDDYSTRINDSMWKKEKEINSYNKILTEIQSLLSKLHSINT